MNLVSNPAMADTSAEAVIEWCIEQFGDDVTVLCSGQDAVLVDLVLSIDAGVEITFIDTGFHFNETIETMLAIADRYRPNLRIVVPWRHLDGVGRPGFCCSDHKVEQLDHALEGKRAWLSGIRRADHRTRSATGQIETDRRGLTKINPIVAWSDTEVARYEHQRDIIVNPLRDAGYPSIGCRPCTSPVEPAGDPRSGRWSGSAKTECGLHL